MPLHPYPRWPLFNRSVVAAFECSLTFCPCRKIEPLVLLLDRKSARDDAPASGKG
jgi:hypothetical protein